LSSLLFFLPFPFYFPLPSHLTALLSHFICVFPPFYFFTLSTLFFHFLSLPSHSRPSPGLLTAHSLSSRHTFLSTATTFDPNFSLALSVTRVHHTFHSWGSKATYRLWLKEDAPTQKEDDARTMDGQQHQ
jgi:hypothetical protein